MKRLLLAAGWACVILLGTISGWAQEPATKTAETKAPAPNTKPALSPLARLQGAKTVFVRNVEGSTIGFDTVVTTLEGWGRYQLVDTAAKADLLIEVTSPDEGGGGGVSVSSSSSTASGKYQESNKTTRELSSGGGPMRLVVRDARTSTTLWFASEQVKGAMKKTPAKTTWWKRRRNSSENFASGWSRSRTNKRRKPRNSIYHLGNNNSPRGISS